MITVHGMPEMLDFALSIIPIVFGISFGGGGGSKSKSFLMERPGMFGKDTQATSRLSELLGIEATPGMSPEALLGLKTAQMTGQGIFTGRTGRLLERLLTGERGPEIDAGQDILLQQAMGRAKMGALGRGVMPTEAGNLRATLPLLSEIRQQQIQNLLGGQQLETTSAAGRMQALLELAKQAAPQRFMGQKSTTRPSWNFGIGFGGGQSSGSKPIG